VHPYNGPGSWATWDAPGPPPKRPWLTLGVLVALLALVLILSAIVVPAVGSTGGCGGG